MENNQEFMKKQPILRLLLSMSVPMMLSMLIQSLYNIVDSIYVARLGTQALTAVSLAYPLQNIIISVAVGIGVGVASVISIHLGEGRRDLADRAASIGTALTLIHCVLFVLFGLLVTRPFLTLFTEDPQTLEWACDYTYVVLCFSSGCLLQLIFEKIFQAIGAMKTTMFLLMAGAIINIILDPIFIFGLCGVPAMGVKGAAIATVIGQFGAFFLYIIVYLRGNYSISIHPRHLCLDWECIRRIYAVGIPSTVMMVLPSVLVSILNGILSAISEVYVAVLGIYYKLQTFIYMPANGIVQGMRPIIGYNYGAGAHKRVRTAIRYSLLAALSVMLVGTLVSRLFPAQIFALFNADDALSAAGVEALRILCLGFLVSSVGLIFSGVFEALGKGKESLIVSLLRQFVITIPLSLLLSPFFGAAGIWISFPAAELIAAIAAWILLKKLHGGAFLPFGKA